jgi:cytochrome b561
MAQGTTYSTAARHFHWWTVLLLAIQLPLGIYIARADTNTLYDTHKLLGLVILVLIVARFIYRLAHGAPADEPTLEWWQKAASHATHWSLYLLLILLPVLGWLGVSLYGEGTLQLFGGLLPLPRLTGAVDQPLSERLMMAHKLLAYVIAALVAMHVGAAVVLHYFMRGDGVLARMLPWAGVRGK